MCVCVCVCVCGGGGGVERRETEFIAVVESIDNLRARACSVYLDICL